VLQKAVSTQNVTNVVFLPSLLCMQVILLSLVFVQYFIFRKIDPSFPAPHIKNFQTYLIRFSTTQSYAPNVTFLLTVIMNTPKSCHSKEQYFTAHNLYSCNKLILHKCNISPSVPNLHDIFGKNFAAPAMDQITQFVQLAQSAKATHAALFNAAGLPVHSKFFLNFWTVEVGLLSALYIREPSRSYSSTYFPRRSKTSIFCRTIEFCP